MLIPTQNNTLFFFILILLCPLSLWAQQINSPCPQIEIQSAETIRLSANERTLICGDPNDPAYQRIPLYQAQTVLRGLLQARGYLTPDFSTQDLKLIVKARTLTTIKNIQIAPSSRLDKSTQKVIIDSLNSLFLGELLTPNNLNAIESITKNLARHHSYACIKVKTEARAQNAHIMINVDRDDPMVFGELESETIEGVTPAALQRFYPFKKSRPFQLSKLQLTEKRFLRSGIVEGSYFQETCRDDNSVDLLHSFLEGPPRLIRFGIGLSTEVGPMTRARWSHQRKGTMASYRELSMQASLRNQMIRALMDEYYWNQRPRQSLLASIELNRDSQEDYEEISLKLRPHLKWTRDSRQHSWQWSTGPTFIAGRYRADNQEMRGSDDYTTAALEGSIQTMSHSFELFDFHPQKGHLLQLSFDLRHPDFGFQEPLALSHFSATKIQPLFHLGRGEVIAALKLNASSTWVEKNVKIESLPPSVKHFGGGSDDLRGYRLNTLPKNEGLGALTKTGLKMELRKTHSFHQDLETLVFMDLMKFGQSPFELDPQLWYSPGFGVRWLSPIGLIQTYVAKGMAQKPKRDDGALFFIGIGGNF